MLYLAKFSRRGYLVDSWAAGQFLVVFWMSSIDVVVLSLSSLYSLRGAVSPDFYNPPVYSSYLPNY